MASKPWEGPSKKYSYIKFKSLPFTDLKVGPTVCTPRPGGDSKC